MKKIIAILVILIIGSFGYLYTKSYDSVTENKYRFVKIEKGDLKSIVSSTGTLSAVTTVQVGTQVSGTISRILVDFNQKVKKGELIALIDTTFLFASVQDAESNVERAKAQIEETERQYNRVVSLSQKNLVSQSDVDNAKYNLSLAKAQFKSAKSSLDRAKINLKYSTIRAPIDGTVIERKCDVGQTVAASFSTPTLFLIANDLSKMQILANVDEGDIGQIKEGQGVKFTVQSYPDKSFEGVVSQIRLQPISIQNVVNYTVVINVENNEGLLLPGMTTTCDFILAEARDVFRVANAALRFKPTQEMMAEMRKGFEDRASAMPDSIKERWQKMREMRQAQRGGGGGQPGGAGGGPGFFMTGGAGGEGRPSGGNRPPDSASLWYLDEEGKLKVVTIKAGITDGQMTEIKSDRVKEGMEIISSVTTTQTTQSFNPFQSLQPQGGRGRRMGGFGF